MPAASASSRSPTSRCHPRRRRCRGSPPELVLVCVKSYDTPAAAEALRPVVRPDTTVLSLQNGIENEDVLARALHLPPLMVALTRIGVELTAPGVIHYSGRGTVVF